MRAGRQQVTASKDEPKLGRERRIIERPRLIKLLDESEARIILLLAPAGYGKTTLARQWAKTLNGAIWVSLTPAHRDVVTFAEDIATGIESLRGPDIGILLITHYERILRYIQPDFVHVLVDGRIVRTGGRELAAELESKGYDFVREELYRQPIEAKAGS